MFITLIISNFKMKKMKNYIFIPIFLAIVLLNSCQKQVAVETTIFGTVELDSTLQSAHPTWELLYNTVTSDIDAVNDEYKQTHAIKQSIPKKVRDKLTEEEQKAFPFLGSLNTKWGSGGESEPSSMIEVEDGEDLPF